jgi:hypothetical protein
MPEFSLISSVNTGEADRSAPRATPFTGVKNIAWARLWSPASLDLPAAFR